MTEAVLKGLIASIRIRICLVKLYFKLDSSSKKYQLLKTYFAQLRGLLGESILSKAELFQF